MFFLKIISMKIVSALVSMSLFVTTPTWAAQSFRLDLVAGEGVQGGPNTVSNMYADNESVPYSYAPMNGYSAVTVVLDGKPAPTSGVISMNSNHWLFAYGQPQSGESFNNMITVPSDFTKVRYPDFYLGRTPLQTKVADPYCAITQETIAFPSEYLGSFPLPSIKGAPLPATVRRGASAKDYWEYGMTNPPTNAGCSGDLHEAFIATLARLKKQGVDHVNIYRDSQLVDTNSQTMKIQPYASWSISPSELKWIVQQAKSFGLQVHDYRQLVDVDEKNNALPKKPTVAWLTKFFDAYIPFIVDRAKEAQAEGVEAFQLDWGVMWFDIAPETNPGAKDLFITKMAEAAQQVRSVFSGKIIYGVFSPWHSIDSRIMGKIDWLYGALWQVQVIDDLRPPSNNLNVEGLKQSYLGLMNLYSEFWGANPKPVVWSVYAQSQSNWFSSGWIEDGFCDSTCSQKTVSIDFSLQAIAFEAMLEAIAEQKKFTTASVDAMAYWYVDVMLGKDSFPNLSQSWRNKPAEAILYEWFKKPPAALVAEPMTLRDAIYLYGQPLNGKGDKVLVGADCDVFQLVTDITSGHTNLAMGQGTSISNAIGTQTAYPDTIEATDAMFAYALYKDHPVKIFVFNDKANPNSSAQIGKATAFGYCYSTKPTAHVYFQQKDNCTNTYSNGHTASCVITDNGISVGTGVEGGLTLRDAIYLYGQPLNGKGDKVLVGENCDVFQLILDVNSGYTDLSMGQASSFVTAVAAQSNYPDRILDSAAMFSYALYDNQATKTFAFMDMNNPHSASQIGSGTVFGYCYSTKPAARVYLREKDKCTDKDSSGQTSAMPGC